MGTEVHSAHAPNRSRDIDVKKKVEVERKTDRDQLTGVQTRGYPRAWMNLCYAS